MISYLWSIYFAVTAWFRSEPVKEGIDGISDDFFDVGNASVEVVRSISRNFTRVAKGAARGVYRGYNMVPLYGSWNMAKRFGRKTWDVSERGFYVGSKVLVRVFDGVTHFLYCGGEVTVTKCAPIIRDGCARMYEVWAGGKYMLTAVDYDKFYKHASSARASVDSCCDFVSKLYNKRRGNTLKWVDNEWI